MSGYSGTPLLKKLGYQPGQTIHTFAAPEWFKQELQKGDVKESNLPTDWAHGFFMNQAALEKFLDIHPLEDIYKGLWVSWPKKAAKVETDLTEQTFRDLILPLGWVDIKVAAIDDTWSGLKFTRRHVVK
jgi:hypothetical protein